MQYSGGKYRVSKYIARVMLDYSRGYDTYYEPFVGGGSVCEKMSPHFIHSFAGDISCDLILLWQALQLGWQPPTEVSIETYNELRYAEHSALRGFVGYACSYGGKWFAGYAGGTRTIVNRKGRQSINGAITGARSLSRKIANMGHVVFKYGDYRMWQPGENSVVYCDPPYDGCTGYSYAGDFNTEEFWTTCKKWASSGALVFVSESDAPDFTECVWSGHVQSSLGSNKYFENVQDNLFRVRVTGDQRCSYSTH